MSDFATTRRRFCCDVWEILLRRVVDFAATVSVVFGGWIVEASLVLRSFFDLHKRKQVCWAPFFVAYFSEV